MTNYEHLDAAQQFIQRATQELQATDYSAEMRFGQVEEILNKLRETHRAIDELRLVTKPSA
jgi:hypothetical protein